MTELKESYLEMYGSIELKRSFCPHCQGMTIIKHGTYVCCGQPFTDTGPVYCARACESAPRRELNKPEQSAILQAQHYRCFYCDQDFGSTHLRHDKPIKLTIHWDHQLPYAYSGDSRPTNYVAACQVCNHIKSDRIFVSEEDARTTLALRRKQLGCDF
jgi:5-methylcytosine-specific restriction endonuclease McrA